MFRHITLTLNFVFGAGKYKSDDDVVIPMPLVCFNTHESPIMGIVNINNLQSFPNGLSVL